MAKKRIVILGGGPGSISTAFELTRKREWQDEFEITIYQLGWRLGGKCAAGRGDHMRIEEHGLHLLGGSYENAFRMLRSAYSEVGWNWTDHFQGRPAVAMEEQRDGNWEHWPYAFADNPGTPGDGEDTKFESLEELIEVLVHWMDDHVQSLGDDHPLRTRPEPAPASSAVPESHKGIFGAAHRALKYLLGQRGKAPNQTHSKPQAELEGIVEELKKFADFGWTALIDLVVAETYLGHHAAGDIERTVEALVTGNREELSQRFAHFRRDYILLVTVATHAIGLIHDFDAINAQGFDALDGQEYKDWIHKHDPSPYKVAANGAPINTLYELVFAYRNGDLTTPAFSAGVGVRSLVRLCFNYKGAIWYQMQGVQFKFFHRVAGLHLHEHQSGIASIELTEQVPLKAHLNEYQPVTEFKGLWTWPSEPDYEQLELSSEDIAALKAMQEDMNGFESNWSPWRERERTFSLRAGDDFDEVVLGISIAALPTICAELIEASPAWKSLVTKVETVETVCVQLWLNRDLADLGWNTEAMGAHPFVAAYAKPLSASGDYSTLAGMEDWPDGQYPKTLWYSCSSWSAGEAPPPSDADFPVRARARFKEQTLDWIGKYLAHLFPNAFKSGGLDWNLLIDPDNRDGVSRFDSQYWRVNVNPSDHYVLSTPNSSAFRLKADESGFKNLTLAGDWTNNGFNLGCVEASVMSGMSAARAILTGAGLEYNTVIVGEKDFPWL